MSVSADYSRKALRDLLLQVDLNPQLRRDTTRNGTVDRPLMPEFVSGVVTSLNLGWQDIDQLGLSFNKRYSNGYSFRAAYTWSDGWGNISNNNQSSTFQLAGGPEPRSERAGAEHREPRAQPRLERYCRGAQDPRHEDVEHRHMDERSDIDHLRLEHRSGSQRRAHRSTAGGNLLWRGGRRTCDYGDRTRAASAGPVRRDRSTSTPALAGSSMWAAAGISSSTATS